MKLYNPFLRNNNKCRCCRDRPYKARGEKKVDLYNHQFRSIAKELIKKRQLNEDSTVRLYINKLPRYIARKLLSDSEFKFNNNYNNINIKKLTNKAISIAKIK